MSDTGTRPRRHQAGYAIAAVSFIGMIAMAGAATMLSTAPVAEVAEIEESLLQIRGHWASVGMLSYVISRGRQDGACDSRCNRGDRDRLDTYQVYAKEIYNAKINQLTTNKPFSLRWIYDEIDPSYHVQLQSTVKDLDDADNGKLSFETKLVVLGGFFEESRTKESVTSANTLAVICTGLATAGDACLNSIGKNNISGISRLQDFRIDRR